MFRDELPNLFPDDERARRLAAQTFLLGEFLRARGAGLPPPRSPAQALVHGHCHQQGGDGHRRRRGACCGRLGLDVELLDAGCCGMAGAFGFEREHYEVSMQLRRAGAAAGGARGGADTLIVADGFSCREQIAQATGRRGPAPRRR